MIHLENLTFFFGNTLLFDRLCFSVDSGSQVALLGRSGSGKTTLFRILAGYLAPQSGTITIRGIPLPEGRRELAYMTQEHLLLPWRTVWEQLLLPLELGKEKKVESEEYKEEAKRLLDRVGLTPFLSYYPDQLSGGMQQRLSLVRALVQRKSVLLLDEPFGALDIATREEMYDLVREECHYNQTTLLFITHDFRDALHLSEEIYLLSEGNITKKWLRDKACEKELREGLYSLTTSFFL